MKSLAAIVCSLILNVLLSFLMLITARSFVEARYLPSHTMAPTLQANDRILLDKVSTLLHRPYQRGEVIVFYPPAVAMGGNDIKTDVLHQLGMASGLPLFPQNLAVIKRVIGLPGDSIRIVAGAGVFVNDQLLDERSYVSEPAEQNLQTFGDIVGPDLCGNEIQPYLGTQLEKEPIVVSVGELFVLGDERRQYAADSRSFGMIRQDRVIGRMQVRVFPKFTVFEPPAYFESIESAPRRHERIKPIASNKVE